MRSDDSQLGAGIVSILDQTLSPWAGTLGSVTGNSERRSGDMLAWSSLQAVGSFLCAGGTGGRRGDGVSQLVRERAQHCIKLSLVLWT